MPLKLTPVGETIIELHRALCEAETSVSILTDEVVRLRAENEQLRHHPTEVTEP